MYLISSEGYKNAGVCILIIKKANKIWASLENVQDGLGVKNMSDLVLKEIYGIYETKILVKDQIKKYKMTEREIFEKYANLSENKLNTKNKVVYAMTLLLSKAAEKKNKRDERKKDRSRKKLMIPELEISECPEYEVKSKLGNIFVNDIFMSITEKNTI